MESFNFEPMQAALNSVNAASQTVGGAASLLIGAQQTFNGHVVRLVQEYQKAQDKIAEQAERIAELEAMLKAAETDKA